MSMICTLTILKINFNLAVQNNLILAVLYLLIIPIFRGISNLNAVHSAECLEQAVSFIGIFLIVPLAAPEQPKDIQEVIYVRQIPYTKILLARLIMSLAALFILIGGFAAIMLIQNCTFTFIHYVAGTTISAMALGSVGFLAAVVSNHFVIGYFVAVGYYLLNFLGSISSHNIFYLFSIESNYKSKIWLVGISLLLISFTLFYEERKSNN